MLKTEIHMHAYVLIYVFNKASHFNRHYDMILFHYKVLFFLIAFM